MKGLNRRLRFLTKQEHVTAVSVFPQPKLDVVLLSKIPQVYGWEFYPVVKGSLE